MKSLLIICVLAAAVAGAVVGCGPQHPYCPQNMGPCFTGFDSGGPDLYDAGTGESTILGQFPK